jgi:energy-coupling factor transporter ATP-binding protein EcfA2
MFNKATKKQSKLRLAIFGPAGSGKTKSALRIANGIVSKEGGRIAFIDTEYKTASKYADELDFDVVDLTNETPIQNFIDTVNEASKSKDYSVLIIDSMSHAWESMLDTIEQVAKARYNGNTFAAWKDKAGGKLQQDFINSILKSNCHIIACFRTKTEWVIETNEKGKMTPKRIGTGVKQRDGIEYEFDIIMEGNIEHYFSITKDRTGKFQDEALLKPDEEFGIKLYEWCNTGINEVELKEKAKEVAISEMANCKTLDKVKNCWSKWKAFQTDADFIQLKEEMKISLTAIPA